MTEEIICIVIVECLFQYWHQTLTLTACLKLAQYYRDATLLSYDALYDFYYVTCHRKYNKHTAACHNFEEFKNRAINCDSGPIQNHTQQIKSDKLRVYATNNMKKNSANRQSRVHNWTIGYWGTDDQFNRWPSTWSTRTHNKSTIEYDQRRLFTPSI